MGAVQLIKRMSTNVDRLVSEKVARRPLTTWRELLKARERLAAASMGAQPAVF